MDYDFTYGFLSFAQNIVKIIGKKLRENLSGNYHQKSLHHT